MTDYYAVLGVPHDATPEQIRSAYRCRARELHPDFDLSSDGSAFRELVTAYEVLSNPGTRRRVDRGEAPRPATPPSPQPHTVDDHDDHADAINGMVLEAIVMLFNFILAVLPFAASCGGPS